MSVHATICDVGPRDGLQNDPTTLAPEVRAELCNRLAATGLPRVEATSFVNPDRVPQMAGAEQVIAAITPHPDVSVSALVLNLRGIERAIAAGVREVHIAYPVTDTFARRNQGMTVAQAVESAGAMIAAAQVAQVRVSATLGAAFGARSKGMWIPVWSSTTSRECPMPARTRSCSPTRSVSVYPAQVHRLHRRR